MLCDPKVRRVERAAATPEYNGLRRSDHVTAGQWMPRDVEMLLHADWI